MGGLLDKANAAKETDDTEEPAPVLVGSAAPEVANDPPKVVSEATAATAMKMGLAGWVIILIGAILSLQGGAWGFIVVALVVILGVGAHLLSMYEGISISELLQKLKVTKQSLNRVLKDLTKLEVIRFEKDEKDTRVKHVYLDEKGKKLFKEIFEIQKKRIYAALLSSKSEEVINFDNVLKKIING